MATAGHDFWFMWNLAQRAYVGGCADRWVLDTFSPGIMIAICWEETQFSNIRQLGFDHDDWMKRWTDIDPARNAPRKDAVTGQVSGNHAIGYVQVERDTIDRWLATNSKLCRGLPGFSDDMVFNEDDKKVSADTRLKRRQWWQTVDLKILADDDAGFQLGWRTFSHLHTVGVASSKKGALTSYAGKNDKRDAKKSDDPSAPKKIGRAASEIIQGWLDTDACLRALSIMSPFHMRVELGMSAANRALAGAYYFSRPDADFSGGFGGTTTDEARRISGVYKKYITQGINNSFVPANKEDALRAELKAALGIVEFA